MRFPANSLSLLRAAQAGGLAAILLGCVSCGSVNGPELEDTEDAETMVMGGTPRRAETASYSSPNVQRGKMPGIFFGDVTWKIPADQKENIRAVATYLKVSAERVIVAGGAEVTNPEYARQLGQQRAIAVKDALIREGIPSSTIITVSFGLDLPGRGDRVEFGFIPTGERPAAGN